MITVLQQVSDDLAATVEAVGEGTMSRVLQQLSDAMADIVAHGRLSLVQLHNGRRGMGAGTVWHPDGLIVTNAHVVRHGTIQATLADRRTVPAQLIATDADYDLAIQSVAAPGLTAITPAEPCVLQPGHWVLALGHPWGVAGAVTAGVVIGVGASPEAPHNQEEWIHASLHLRPGHSGGPLVDVYGHVIGINTMMAGPDVGLAIPVSVVQGFVRQVRECRGG
jgi:serine protease Do